jgi:galactosylceramidase
MNLSVRLVFLVTTLTSGAFAQRAAVRVDGASPGRRFEGVGAVSAGASSRLLADYPEPAKSHVLDYLFTPGFGASLHHLKVEIGGGENSTCGSEPSHAVSKDELARPVGRGYEFWLLKEARRRNPRVILDCLPWSFPGWLPGKFTQESADWFAAFLDLARDKYGVRLDWIAAAENENSTDLDWIVKTLRPTLDRRGYKDVKLQAPDDIATRAWKIFDDFDTRPDAAKVVQAVGYHYVSGREPWAADNEGKAATTEKARNSGKPLWASEEWSTGGGRWDPRGALYVARLINKVYIRDRITKIEFWAPFDGIYETLAWHDTGFLQADQPWSGHFEIWPALWAVAHTTQFTAPGWRYLDTASGRFSPSTWNGSYVTLRSVSGNHWSMIVTTGGAAEMEGVIAGGLNSGLIHVWKSNARDQFVEQSPLSPRNGRFTIAFEPDSIYTLTTTTGQRRGAHAAPPAKPFPFPYTEDFEKSPAGSTPRYFSDQKGTFEVAAVPGRGKCLKQIVPVPGHPWVYMKTAPKPYSVIGDPQWSDYSVHADVFIHAGDVEIGGRFDGDMSKLSYRLALDQSGKWRLIYREKILASGAVANFPSAAWRRLGLSFSGSRISASLDGNPLAEVTDPSASRGMAYIASTYHPNLFDNVSIGKP